MIITRDRYTVNRKFVEQNRKILDEFIAALTAASVLGFSYRVFFEEHGQTFFYLVTSQDDPSASSPASPSRDFNGSCWRATLSQGQPRWACRACRQVEIRIGRR